MLKRQLEVLAGDDIRNAVKAAFKMVSKSDPRTVVWFDFNGVRVNVSSDSEESLVYRDWTRAISGYLGKDAEIGPVYAAELTREELDSDAKIEAENHRRHQEEVKRYQEQCNKNKAEFQRAIESAPAFHVTDVKAWSKCVSSNIDPYGKRIVDYAEQWGRLMQSKIDAGETIDQCAEQCSRIADYDGITGFMYGSAVSILSGVWIHGEELRRWHNLKTQIGNEGEQANDLGTVLNPALLTIETKE